jgi:hypothetical protein
VSSFSPRFGPDSDRSTSVTKAPAVIKTITKDKHLCFATETKTVGQSESIWPVTVIHADCSRHIQGQGHFGKRWRCSLHRPRADSQTIVNRPTETKTKWAPALTYTKTHVKVRPTCDVSEVQQKRGLDDEDAEVLISNAERIRRGLPLNKPEKRHGRPPRPGPSCVPSTSVSWVHATEVKTLTPTQWATTTKCRYTHTVDKVSE